MTGMEKFKIAFQPASLSIHIISGKNASGRKGIQQVYTAFGEKSRI